MFDKFDKADVAARLRSLRESKGYSLRELAGRSGVAVSFLSKIEAGKASPTIMSLLKILEALDTQVAAFFGRSDAPSLEDIVFKRAGMRALEEVDRTWWYAFPERPDIKLVMTYEEWGPRSRLTEIESHRTDLCGFVVEGTLTLELPGRGVVQAEQGDGFYIRAQQQHIARNDTDGPMRLVVVQMK